MSVVSKNQVGIAGEFAVLSQLALRGFDANLTLGNTKGVDILVSHPETGSMYRLEVKTHHNNNPYRSEDFGAVEAHWRMGDKHETNEDPKLFYCFVSIAKDTESFDFYIVPSVVVAKFIRESHKYWLSGNVIRKDTAMRSFMLGKKGESYKLDMPISEAYKSRWDLLK
jgi:polysaccharide pyruvyl transferase WcaK-like protein